MEAGWLGGWVAVAGVQPVSRQPLENQSGGGAGRDYTDSLRYRNDCPGSSSDLILQILTVNNAKFPGEISFIHRWRDGRVRQSRALNMPNKMISLILSHRGRKHLPLEFLRLLRLYDRHEVQMSGVGVGVSHHNMTITAHCIHDHREF